MDGWFRVTAGVFSSDPARARAAGVAVGLDPARSYGDVAEMLARERERLDRIDAVAIMTPNDTHYAYSAAALDAGLDVVCDKPVTHDFDEACDLVARTREQGRDIRDRARLFRLSDDALRAAARARRRDRRPCAWFRSSTSRAASRRVSRTGRRTTACAGSSIPGAAGSRW